VHLRNVVPCAALLVLCSSMIAHSQTLQERLGFEADDVVLIINGDDFGMCHSSNVAVLDALENGCLTSATLMMPCPWILEAIHYWQEHPELDIGLHLTHTSEWNDYRWGPVAPVELVPGLIDAEGYMHDDVEPDGVYQHATADEAYIEAKAQVDRALELGVQPSHLDSHMGSLQYNDDYWDQYLKLAEEYDLPLRLAGPELYALMGMKNRREIADKAGIVGPTLLFGYDTPGDPERIAGFYSSMLKQLQPGVWELLIHPAVLSDELKAITGSAEVRAAEYAWVTAPETRQLIDELGIKLVGYRELLELQRAARGGK